MPNADRHCRKQPDKRAGAGKVADRFEHFAASLVQENEAVVLLPEMLIQTAFGPVIAADLALAASGIAHHHQAGLSHAVKLPAHQIAAGKLRVEVGAEV